MDPVVYLPYDERKVCWFEYMQGRWGELCDCLAIFSKVSSIMVECARHVNLVKVPTEVSDSEAAIGRALSECDYKQRSLLKQLMVILEGEKLSRLAFASVS